MGMRGGGGWGGKDAVKKPLNPQTPKRVWRTFDPYRMELVGIAVAVFLSAGIGLLPPFLLQRIINEGLLAKNLDLVTKYTVYTLLAVAVSTVFALGYGYLSVMVGQRIMRDLRGQLYDHLQGMPLKFFTSTRTGEIQSRLANDVSGVQGVLSDTVANVLSSVTTVVSTLIAMVYFDWRLTLLSVGVLPVFAVIGAQVGNYGGTIRKKSQEQLANINSTMQETLSVSGALLLKTSGRRTLAFDKFQEENNLLTDTNIKQAMVFRFFFNLIGLTFTITPALVYWLAGWLIASQHDTSLDIGKIVAFSALQSRLFFPLTGLLNSQVEVTSAFALFDRIFEYLDMKQEITDAPNAVTVTPEQVRGAVAFENVSFRYDAEQPEPTLQQINFDAKPGQLIALVGASGAGKTTLTYLIPRLYDADTGRVLIDGIDVKQIALASLGQIIGVVTQETYLVHDTIRENLRYGRADASDDELIAAAKAAAIHDHINGLPAGYDTVVGERGYKLSGGEKQRIAIARAILKNPLILILDEATSALDTQSERLIQDALARLQTGRTTFAIAHRLSTILAADQILVMEQGQIVERGTHAVLLAQNGVYARLHAAQFDSGAAERDEPAAIQFATAKASV